MYIYTFETAVNRDVSTFSGRKIVMHIKIKFKTMYKINKNVTLL